MHAVGERSPVVENTDVSYGCPANGWVRDMDDIISNGYNNILFVVVCIDGTMCFYSTEFHPNVSCGNLQTTTT